MPIQSIVVVAGVPAYIEREFTKKIPNLEEGIRKVIFLPCARGATFSPRYIQELYQLFSKSVKCLLPLDQANIDAPSGFSGAITIFFQSEESRPTMLMDAFGTETFVVSAQLPDTQSRTNAYPNLVRNLANDIIRILRKLIRKAESILLAIGKEVTSNANRTPLLLPFSNFGALEMKELRNEIMELIHSENEFVALKSIVEKFRKNTRQVKLEKTNYWSFVNEQNIVFGRPSALHGTNWNLGEGHKISCYIRSRLRFGPCINPRFHYDCVKHRGVLPKSWDSCHGQSMTFPESRAHVNIAPSDFVR